MLHINCIIKQDVLYMFFFILDNMVLNCSGMLYGLVSLGRKKILNTFDFFPFVCHFIFCVFQSTVIQVKCCNHLIRLDIEYI